MIPVVTIDGPSGAGKGTICRLVAQATGYELLDSGALYRLVALASLNAQVDLVDEIAVADISMNMDISFVAEMEGTKTYLDGNDVSREIRTEKVGMSASRIAAYPKVRAALLQRQRDFCEAPGLVADGRDMGTVVFPQAPVKVFLTASAEERASRRLKQLQETGKAADFETILQDIKSRDEQDRTRAAAPLVPAVDAIELDSTSMSIDEVYKNVMREIDKKINNV